MGRAFLFVLVFNWLCNPVYAQDSAMLKVNTKYLLGEEIVHRTDELHTPDTSREDFFIYHPAYRGGFYAFNGNLGSPQYRLDYQPEQQVGFDKGIFRNYPFFTTEDQVRYYRTRSPFTELTYVNAQLKEQLLHVVHTQNILPRWNMGVDYKRMDAVGYYAKQYSNYLGFTAFTWYSNKSGRYNVYANFIVNRIRQEENWGLKDSSIFSSGDVNDPLADIRVNSAQNKVRQFSYSLTQTYDLGKKDTVSVDKQKFRRFNPSARLIYQVSAARNSFIYQDDNPDSARYVGRYALGADPTMVQDSFHVDQLNNKWSITNDLGSDTIPKALALTGSVFHSWAKYTNQGGGIEASSYYGAAAELQIAKGHTFSPFFAVSGARFSNGSALSGAIDYKAQAGLRIRLSSRQQMLLHASYLQNQGGLLYQRKQLATGFSVPQDYYPVYQGAIYVANYGIDYENKAIRLKLSYNHYDLDGMLHGSAGPFLAQLNGVQSMEQLRLNWGISAFKFLHLDSRIVYQYIHNAKQPVLPRFMAYESLYFTARWFKVLAIRIGFDTYFYSNYVLPVYDPLERTFFVPSPSQQLSHSANYPLVDFVAAAKLKRARIFFRYDHLNQDLMPASGLYSASRYPVPPRTFKIGVEWRFFD